MQPLPLSEPKRRRGGPTPRLTRELIPKAAALAAKGLRPSSIAAGLGVVPSTLTSWLRRAQAGTGSPLEVELLAALQKSQSEAEQALVAKLLAADDPGTAKWLLTHGPWRDSWSDAAAERRAVASCLASVVAAIAATGLSRDDETRLLLHLQAAGQPVDVPLLTVEPVDPTRPQLAPAEPPAATEPPADPNHANPPAHASSRRYFGTDD